MFRSYLKIAIRNLFKKKAYAFINALGLAMGMVCFILIMLYVGFEFSYDKFHEKANRIYRVVINRTYPDKVRTWGRTAFPIATAFKSEYPEIQDGTRMATNNNPLLIRYGDKNIDGNRVIFADPNFFDVFTVPLLQGDPKTALVKPNSAVISQTTATNFFGGNLAVGKTFRIGATDYTVTGVSQDIPGNCHFHYDFLLSLITLPVYNGDQWINNWGAFNYLLLKQGADASTLETKLEKMVVKYMAPEVEEEVKTSFKDFLASGNGYRFILQPMTDIHLKSNLDQEIEPNGNITYVILFSAISIFVLIIACINFMNLATARSANRAKEVGIRKTIGSARLQLVGQFLLESSLLSFIALIMAMGMVQVFLPFFNDIAGKQLQLNFTGDFHVLSQLILFTLLVSLLAGGYPAFFLSSYRPVAVLRGVLKQGPKGNKIRNSLVIFQFAISIILIVGTLVVNSQIQYMLNKDLGFNKHNVIVIRNARLLAQQFSSFKQDLLANSMVTSVSGSFNFPAGAFDGNVHKPEGASDDQATSVSSVFADYDYIETMGMELLSGRNFSLEFSTDRNSYILNQTAAKMLGLKDPINARITDNRRTFTVIGLLKDFHFKSLHNEITPLVYVGVLNNQANFISVRFHPGKIADTLSLLKKTWQKFTGGSPFTYSFLDDDLKRQYTTEQKTRTITGVFSIIAIFIGCLGLFGLAAFSAEQRTKEIGVRKILGSSAIKICLLLVKDFTRQILYAFVIGCSIAYLVMRYWLDNFAYSVEIKMTHFLLAGILALGIALITVSYQAIRAALRNPVDSLRYE